MGVEIVVPIAFFATVICLALGIPLVRAISKRVDAEARRPPLAPEVATRLERMEQSIDAIAVEIERISEGQRFTTRLLSSGRAGEGNATVATHEGDAGIPKG